MAGHNQPGDKTSRNGPQSAPSLIAGHGFTLIEVAVAIVILGLGLSSLIALQTRMADNVQRERALFRATLAAQYLVTFIEIENDPPEPGDTAGDLPDALRKAGFFEGLGDEGRSLEEQMQGWKLEQHISSVDYGDFQDILRRVEIVVSWDAGDRGKTSLVLFMNTPINKEGSK